MRYLFITMSMATLLLMPVYLFAEVDDTGIEDDPAPPVAAKQAEKEYSNKPKHEKPKKIPGSAKKTIRYEGDKIIEEYRVKGRLTMVKIISKKAKPYFIYYDENWNEAPGSKDLDDTPKTPYWKIFSW